jgi:hypothetical protein
VNTAPKPARLDVPCGEGHTAVLIAPALGINAFSDSYPCGQCGKNVPLHLERLDEHGGLHGCLGCGLIELYTRKDFPPAIGIGIVVIAAVLVPFLPKWYPSLIAAAILDFALYRFAPDVVICYACGTQHRGFNRRPKHPGFDRTIEERMKYGEKSVMGSAMRTGGTADAPEPEH